MQVSGGPLIDFSVSERRLTDNFRLIQTKIRQYDGRLEALDELVDTINRSLRQEKVLNSQRFEGLELKMFKSIEHKITNSINFYVSSQIKEFFEANRTNTLTESDVETKIQRKADELKAAVKAELIQQNQQLIKAEVRELKRKDRKKEKEHSEKKLLYGSGAANTLPMDVELTDKLDQFFSTVDEVNVAIRENTKKVDRLEESSYNSTSQLNTLVDNLSEELRECKRFVADSNENMKMQLVKLKTQVMIPLEKNKPISEESIINGFAELRENMARSLTKTEFESLYNKNIWNNLNQIRDEMDSLKKQVKSHEEQRKYLGHITEGIEKYEQFIASSFDKTSQKQQNIRQAFAVKFDQLASKFDQMNESQLATRTQLTALSEFSHESFRSLEERWTSLEYQQSLSKQEIQLTNANLQKAKQEIDSSNYSMKHMANDFDKKVIQTVNDLKESMNRLKGEFDSLYAAQAKKSEIAELWKAVNMLESKVVMYKTEADQVYHLNKRSWMLAESEIVRGKGSLEKLSHTVFANKSQRNTFKMSQIAVRTTRMKPKEQNLDQ